ncbi:MAG: hypothetical protein R3F49_17765 [Planctomycetota bacterium]
MPFQQHPRVAPGVAPRALPHALAALLALAAPAHAQRSGARDPHHGRPAPTGGQVDDAVAAPRGEASPLAQDPQPRALAAAPDGAPRSAAQAEPPLGSGPANTITPPDPRSMIHYTEHEDGLWIRGRTYKARVAPTGFTYVPFLGTSAPRNFPLQLRLAAATLAGVELRLTDAAAVTRDGARFVLDRGAVDVVYDVALDSIEQSFVIDAAGATGELVLELALESELEGAPAAAGLSVRCPYGGVSYGAAVVFDGRGRRADVPLTLAATALTLTVPAEFLRAAEGLIVVDPTLSTFSVDTSSGDQDYPDVSYDATTNRYTYVYEDMFSGTDTDIYRTTVSAQGLFVSAGFIEGGAEQWTSPSAANLGWADRTLVAAERVNPTTGLVEIAGRIFNEATGALGPVIVIGDTGGSWDNFRPDVGGSASPSSNAVFIVVWERRFSASQSLGRFRTVTADGALNPVQFFDASGSNSLTEEVRVSKSTGDALLVNRWNIAYRVQNLTNDVDQVRSLQVNTSGSIVSGPSVVEVGPVGHRLREIDVSDGLRLAGLAPTYVVTYDDATHATRDLALILCRDAQPVALFDLGERENTALQPDQAQARLAATGDKFLVTYLEPLAGAPTSHNVFLTAFDLVESNEVAISERRTHLGTTVGFYRGAAAIASRASGGVADDVCGIGWARRDNATSTYNVFGVLFNANLAPSIAKQYCSGNPNSTGDRGFIAAYGDRGTLTAKVLLATALPPNAFGYFLCSTSVTLTSNPGGSAGNLCLGGAIGRYSNFVTSSGPSGTITFVLDPTQLSTPNGPVPAIAGQRWQFQLWHRDAISTFTTSNFTNAVSLLFE